ncbi:MAG TPA: hypothetical protein VHE09_02515 [Rhizomicrobium sp.]|jgi:uncharacterized membrane protein|nr:hypothetical protein [Rhizomicrobium sp.]
MKTLMLLVGVVALAFGLLWIGQGSGYVNWPASSFMINQMKWAYYGMATAVIGIGLIWYSRR